MGVRTVMLARYEIKNISDDKPKFTIRRSGTIKRNSYSTVEGDHKVRIIADNADITESDVPMKSYLCIYASQDIVPGYTVTIRFNRDAAIVTAPRQFGGGYSVDLQAYMDGFIRFHISSSGDIHIPLEISPRGNFKPGTQFIIEVSAYGIKD